MIGRGLRRPVRLRVERKARAHAESGSARVALRELGAGAPYRISGFTRRPNGDLFDFKQLAAENVAKFYHRDNKTGNERRLIDPAAFPSAKPKELFPLSFVRLAPDATKWLEGLTASGSDNTQSV